MEKPKKKDFLYPALRALFFAKLQTTAHSNRTDCRQCKEYALDICCLVMYHYYYNESSVKNADFLSLLVHYS